MYTRGLSEIYRGIHLENLLQALALMEPHAFGNWEMADSNALSSLKGMKMKLKVFPGAQMENGWQLAVEIKLFGLERLMIREKMLTTIVYLLQVDILRMLNL